MVLVYLQMKVKIKKRKHTRMGLIVCVETWPPQEKQHMQMNTIKILLNFGQNNKQVNTLPPC